jgi:hypothetical protein
MRDHRRCEQEFFVGGVEKKPMVSGVAESNMAQDDPIVSPTLSPYMSVDLGARSLVSGVDCNDPENTPIRFCLLFSFSRHCDIVHHHAYLTLHVLSNKIIFVKPILISLVWFYNYLPLMFLF